MLPLDPYCQSAFGQIRGFLRIWDSDHWDSGFRTMAFGDPLAQKSTVTLKPANHHHFRCQNNRRLKSPVVFAPVESRFAGISFCRIWFFFQAWLAGHIKSSMKFGEFAPLTHVSPLISHDIPIRYPYKISIDIPFYQHFSLWNPHSVL